MRVISGSKRGLNLLSPPINVRPTLDRVKEALFSMLIPYLPADNVLDLFSGSGALGIEALSRGASHAVFVDCFKESVEVTKKNVQKAHFESLSEIVQTDAVSFLKKSNECFDIVFVDPPYQSGLYESVLDSLACSEILKETSVVVLEWDTKAGVPFVPDFFEVIKQRNYGRVGITILRRKI